RRARAPRSNHARSHPSGNRAGTPAGGIVEKRKAKSEVQLLIKLEVALPRPANRTEPIIRNVRELRARRHPAVGISLGGVVDESARDADVALPGHGAGR